MKEKKLPEYKRQQELPTSLSNLAKFARRLFITDTSSSIFKRSLPPSSNVRFQGKIARINKQGEIIETLVRNQGKEVSQTHKFEQAGYGMNVEVGNLENNTFSLKVGIYRGPLQCHIHDALIAEDQTIRQVRNVQIVIPTKQSKQLVKELFPGISHKSFVDLYVFQDKDGNIKYQVSLNRGMVRKNGKPIKNPNPSIVQNYDPEALKQKGIDVPGITFSETSVTVTDTENKYQITYDASRFDESKFKDNEPALPIEIQSIEN